MVAENPATTPWHARNQPKGASADWSERCRAWVEELGRTRPEQTLRTGWTCGTCSFPFAVRTSYYSMRSSSDVTNYGTCCNPDCRHEWEECS